MSPPSHERDDVREPTTPSAPTLGQLLCRYIEVAETGQSVSLDELCAEAPELRQQLETCVLDYEGIDIQLGGGPRFEQGTQLLHYRVERKIGQGGMGAVYAARDQKLDRLVAIKVLPSDLATDSHRLERFRREARVVAGLNHHNIVTVYSIEETERTVFMTMELVEGETLDQELPSGGMELVPLLEIALQLASAVAAAHLQGVTHRDLKPQNVMLSGDGEVKVLDFGLAKLAPTLQAMDGSTLSRTGEGRWIGTAPYMAPEQVRGDEVDARADVFAIGILLFELAMGRRPFTGATHVALLESILTSDPLSEEDLPAALVPILEVCLEKDPEKRFATAAEVHSALMGLRLGQEGPRRTKTASSRERRYQLMLLEKVESFWIDQVFDRSLHGNLLLGLGRQRDPSSLSSPWGRVVELPAGQPELLSHDKPITDVFEESGRALLIHGGPGAGKTTTLLQLARSLLKKARHDAAESVPVVFKLSSWSRQFESLSDWLISELGSKYQIPKRMAARWLEDENLMLLLDGLDEVAAEQRRTCILAINDHRAEHGLTPVIVTSRTSEYRSAAGLGKTEAADFADQTPLSLGTAIRLEPLTEQQIQEYLESLGSLGPELQFALLQDAELRKLARTPLMLSLMATCLRKNESTSPDEAETQQDAVSAQWRRSAGLRGALWSTYVDRTRTVEDTQAKRPASAPLPTEAALRWIARKMTSESETLFLIEDLQPSLLTRRGDRLTYFALSRGIVGILLGLAIEAVSRLIGADQNQLGYLTLLGLSLGALVGALDWARTELNLHGRIWKATYVLVVPTSLVLCLFLIANLLLKSAVDFRAMLAFPLPLTLLYGLPRHARSRSTEVAPASRVAWSHRGALLGLGLLVAAGSVPILALVLLGGQADAPVVAERWLLTMGGFFVGVFGLSGRSIDPIARVNQGTKVAFRNAALGGSLLLLFSGLLGQLSLRLIEPDPGSFQLFNQSVRSYGAPFVAGVIGFFWFGGTEIVKHLSLRLVLRMREGLPLALAQTLALAERRGLVLRTGNAYLFLHPTLQKFFAHEE